MDSALTEADARASRVRAAKAFVAKLGWFLASAPALFLGIVLLHALHVRLYLGRWPVVYRDTPKTALLSVHEYGLMMPIFYLSLFGVPFWLVIGTALVAAGMMQGRIFRKQLALIVAGIGAVALLVALDPTGYVEWFLD